MNSYNLIGLPEGLIGKPVVLAKDFEDLFYKYPILRENKDKFSINGCTLKGVSPCDG